MIFYFITGNANKFADLKKLLPQAELLNIDLPEIQDLDAKTILKEKLNEAFKHHSGPFLVDDVSLYMSAYNNNFPGPLIKWFMKAAGVEGIAKTAAALGDTKALVKTLMAYAKSPDEVYYFEGEAQGQLVMPKGKGGFGWDVIFQPEGSDKTYAELKETNNNQPNAMRMEALNKLKSFLDKEQ